jgi:hypothetical protein
MIVNKSTRSSYGKYRLKATIDPSINSESGFTMPLVLGLGLVMIIVASSIILRSQSDRSTTNLQRETNRVLSVSEAGVIRVRSFLDRYKILATKNLNTWSNTIDNLSPAQANCRSIDPIVAKQQAVLFQGNNWIDLDASDLRKGKYRVVDYQYQNGIGKLTIMGAVDVYNNAQNTAKSTLTVDIPIGSEGVNIQPPALWANTFNLNPNQKVTGQIRATSCPQLPQNDPHLISGVDSNNIALISGLPSGEIIADPFTSIPSAKVAPNNAIALPAITTSIVLPRPSSIDLPDANGEYHYLVDIDNATSKHSIKLQDIDRIELNLAADRKVNLYLKGNIDFGGSQTLNVNASNPNLRIYGSPQTVKLTIKDNAAIVAFIHAPSADVKSISSATPNPNRKIAGAVWVNSWDSATSSSEIPIMRSGNWADFGISKSEQPSQIGAISSWRRVEGN